MVLDGNGEYVLLDRIAGTALPEGRYLFVVRAKDTDQVVSDFFRNVYNTSDGNSVRIQDGVGVSSVLTGSFSYYVLVFHISGTDVLGTDNIRSIVSKILATENTMFIDYFLMIFLGDGESGPMDLAHAALRGFNQKRRIFER